jgi:hypothetical protein
MPESAPEPTPAADALSVTGTGGIIPDGVASWKQMSKPSSRQFPVIVTQLPVTRCEVCHRTIAYRPGTISDVLTEHYRRAHPEALGLTSG